MKKALIAGIRGQDGHFLNEFLEKKDYKVKGVSRESGDLFDPTFVEALVSGKYDEIYNFASVIKTSAPWDDAANTVRSTAIIPLNFLEAIRKLSPESKFFQASTSEIFGDPLETPQSETTLCRPSTPYGYGKLLAHQAVEGYRKQFGIFAVSGILFPHESPLRKEHFVMRKVTKGLANIANGSQKILELGDLDAKRDWSFAGDIVEGAWLSLQHHAADDYVFASGETHTVRELVEEAAHALGITLRWKDSGAQEKGVDDSEKTIVAVNPTFMRPQEKFERRGNVSKATRELDWRPRTSFKELVEMMARADLK